MRADRLIELVLLLQSRPSVTAAEVADSLAVSIATARRDLAALAAAGVPLYPQRGRGGGWQLVGGARTDLTGLTEHEAHALLAGLAASDGGGAAVAKLIQALPATFRDGARRVTGARRHEGAWGDAEPVEQPDEVAILIGAVAGLRRVGFEYRDRSREVLPWLVGSRGGHWYLLAAAPDLPPRMFRLDRISGLEVGAAVVEDLPGPSPAERDAAWQQAVDRVEELRGRVTGRVRVDPAHLDALRRAFGRQAGDPVLLADGTVELEVAAQNWQALAEQLAGWVAVAEARGPTRLRRELASLGERLVGVYSAG